MRTDSIENGSEESTKSYEDSWIYRFMSRKENAYLDKIHDSFLQDRFNFFGLKDKIENFEDAFLLLQDKRESDNFETESIAYLMAHQRWVYTKTGMETVLDKVLNWEFGTCHRIGCRDIPYTDRNIQ